MSGDRAAQRPEGRGTGLSRNYTDRTLKLLWGRAAGHCAMPDCRVELFADATDYDPVVVIGDMAHVAGASDDGPRSTPELNAKERNDYENLILLCKHCHGRIDKQARSNPAGRLKEIKQAHEAWVRASLPERGRSRTGWIVLGLRGDHPIDLATAHEALAPDFIDSSPHWLEVPTDTDDWQAVDGMIAATVTELLSGGDTFDRRIAVCAIAPISACMALGYHLTSRPNVRHFQHHRDDRSWAWPRRAAPAQDIIVSGLADEDPECRVVTFLFHFSAIIADEAFAEIAVSHDRRVDFRVGAPSTAWLQHPDQVRWAAIEARQAFERAMQLFPRCELWRVLYAGPAPVAVAIGQQMNPTMYPLVQLYEYRHKETPRYRTSILLQG